MFKTKKNIIITFIASIAILSFGIWIFLYSSYGMGGLEQIALGTILPDTIPNPSIDAYRDVISDMGEIGREYYLTRIRVIDTVFPFLYTFPMFVLLGALIYRFTKKRVIRNTIPYIAFIPALFDLLENHYLHILVHDYPHFDLLTVENTLLFTTLKAITRDGLFFFLIAYWILVGFIKLINKIKVQNHVYR